MDIEQRVIGAEDKLHAGLMGLDTFLNHTYLNPAYFR